MVKPGRHICTVCNYIYEEPDRKRADAKHDTPFEQLPNDWTCPSCGASKDMYQPCSCVELDTTPGHVEQCEIHGEQHAR